MWNLLCALVIFLPPMQCAKVPKDITCPVPNLQHPIQCFLKKQRHKTSVNNISTYWRQLIQKTEGEDITFGKNNSVQSKNDWLGVEVGYNFASTLGSRQNPGFMEVVNHKLYADALHIIPSWLYAQLFPKFWKYRRQIHYVFVINWLMSGLYKQLNRHQCQLEFHFLGGANNWFYELEWGQLQR